MTTTNDRHPIRPLQRLTLAVALTALLPMGTALAAQTPDAVVAPLLPEDRAALNRHGPSSPVYPGGDLVVSRSETTIDNVTETISTHLTSEDRASLTIGPVTIETDQSITTAPFQWGPRIV